MLHLEQTFNHDKFNFTKIDEEKEVIFQLRRLDGDVREVCSYFGTWQRLPVKHPAAAMRMRSSEFIIMSLRLHLPWPLSRILMNVYWKIGRP